MPGQTPEIMIALGCGADVEFRVCYHIFPLILSYQSDTCCSTSLISWWQMNWIDSTYFQSNL